MCKFDSIGLMYLSANDLDWVGCELNLNQSDQTQLIFIYVFIILL